MQRYTYLVEIKSLKELLDKHKEEAQNLEELLNSENEAELKELAKDELSKLHTTQAQLEKQLKLALMPKDPNDSKNIIMEIRSGTGGEEASLFANELFSMYARYAEKKSWKLEILESDSTELGGLKEIVFSISGNNVYGTLKYEMGVHRVQRIPITDSGGRIQTSAATVAVLAEAEEAEINIRENELRIDVFRSSGPGGQSVNTTDSAVRITHLPSGLVVSCQDEKSQLKNKQKALRVLRARLLEIEQAKQQAERSQNRKQQIGSGDRSERIRTYNYPQNRLTDHRINLTLYKLDQILQGNLDEVTEALLLYAQEQAMTNGSDHDS
ncbi:UNVERIFIED_CONTAM: hypothetical protein PYX00_010870 [Menopon gallinae]|uniref:Prokaryotic-type class I peptide chain release factors domain-containing protein n=1 Tax=Menopon gallinae TaxID=328185 RepID=A0AAW2H695_9NEOP